MLLQEDRLADSSLPPLVAEKNPAMTTSINDGANLSTSLLGGEPTKGDGASRRRSRRQSSVATIVEGVDSRVHAYERERVPDERLKGWLSFFGLFSSRHTAGTEFAIGPLFVARGATAIDVIVGLFIGNLLAVLSWRFLVGPLACKKRLTGTTRLNIEMQDWNSHR